MLPFTGLLRIWYALNHSVWSGISNCRKGESGLGDPDGRNRITRTHVRHIGATWWLFIRDTTA